MATRRAGASPGGRGGALARAPLVAQVASSLAATMNAAEAAERLTRLLVPTLGDWCVVTLVEDDESRPSRRVLRDIGSWHVDPRLRGLVQQYAAARLDALSEDSFLHRALIGEQLIEVRAGATAALQGVLRPGPVHDRIARLAPDAVVVAPLVSRGRTLGALSLFCGPGRPALTLYQLDTLRETAAAAALALDNARLYRQQRHVAETFQRALLTPPVEPDHLQIVVRYRPAAEIARVGGDWYDAFLQPDGTTVLAIGDVVGHDMEAAATMSQLRSMLRTVAVVTDEGPAGILRLLDGAMQTLGVTTMATALVARIEQTDDERRRGLTRLRWSSAGHPPPMIIHPDGTVPILTGGSQGLLLGVAPDRPRVDTTLELQRGATVLLYTDGLVESRERPLREGIDELRRALERWGAEDLDALCDNLLDALPAGPGEDDIALVAVRLHPQDRPRPAEAGPARTPG